MESYSICICLFVTSLFHLAWCPHSSSMLQHVSEIWHFFCWHYYFDLTFFLSFFSSLTVFEDKDKKSSSLCSWVLTWCLNESLVILCLLTAIICDIGVIFTNIALIWFWPQDYHAWSCMGSCYTPEVLNSPFLLKALHFSSWYPSSSLAPSP